MTLATLPNDVLHEILLHLTFDKPSLLAVSYTSKRLNYAANYFLYRNLYCLSESRDKTLYSCLRMNPSNIQFIGSYSPRNPRHLGWLWSNPISLRELYIRPRMDSPPPRNPYLKCLAMRHDEFSVEEVVIILNTNYEKCLLSRMDSLKGLKRLRLTVEHNSPALKEYTLPLILETLNCPQLERLTVAGGLDSVPSLDDRFPSLVSLELEPERVDGAMSSPTEVLWKTLSALMEKSLFFRIRPRSLSWSTHWRFYKDVLEYAEIHHLDATPLIQWLTLSACHFAPFDKKIGDDPDIFEVQLWHLTAFHQLRKTLQTIRTTTSLHDKPMALDIVLNQECTDLARVMPSYTRRLKIWIREPAVIPPYAITDCIRAVPQLRRIEFFIYVAIDERGRIVPVGRFTHATFTFPRGTIDSWKVLYMYRGKGPSWKPQSPLDGNEEVINELMDLFNLSSGLMEIKAMFSKKDF